MVWFFASLLFSSDLVFFCAFTFCLFFCVSDLLFVCFIFWLSYRVLFERVYRDLPSFTEFYRVLPSFTGFCRVFDQILPGFTGFDQLLQSLIGIDWAGSSFTWFLFTKVLSILTSLYRVLPSFTEFYRVLPSFTEFYRVLPSFWSNSTGFNWVLSTSMEFHWVWLSWIEFYRVFDQVLRDFRGFLSPPVVFHWTWLSWIEFHSISFSFTKIWPSCEVSHCVLPSFTEFYRVLPSFVPLERGRTHWVSRMAIPRQMNNTFFFLPINENKKKLTFFFKFQSEKKNKKESKCGTGFTWSVLFYFIFFWKLRYDVVKSKSFLFLLSFVSFYRLSST